MKRSLLCSAVLFACTTISFNACAEGIVIENEKDKVIEDGTIGSLEDEIGLNVKNSTVTVVDDEIHLKGSNAALRAEVSTVVIGDQNTSEVRVDSGKLGIAIWNNADVSLEANTIKVNASKTGIQNWGDSASRFTAHANQLTINGDENAILAGGGGVTTLTATEIITLSGSGDGVAAQGATVNLEAASVMIGTEEQKLKRGIYANKNGTVNLDLENTGVLSINATNQAIFSQANSSVNLMAKKVNLTSSLQTIRAGSKKNDLGKSKINLSADTINLISTGEVAGLAMNESSIHLDANTIDIKAENGVALAAQDKATISVLGQSVLVTATNGLRATSSSTFNLEATDIDITAKNRGIEADKSQVSIIGQNINIRNADDIAVFALNNAEVEILGNDIDIDANWGLCSQGGGHLSVNGKGVGTSIVGNVGMLAFSGSTLTVSGNLYVNAPDILQARHDEGNTTTVKINEDKSGIVKLEGNINFNNNTGSQIADADITLNLVGPESYWKGTTVLSWDTPDKPNASTLVPENMKLLIADGAQWTPTSSAGLSDKIESTPLNNLNLDGGIINITDETVHVEIDKAKGAGTINLGTNLGSLEAGSITIGQSEGEVELDVNFTSKDIEHEFTSDEITVDQAKELMTHIEGDNIELTADVPEGFTEVGYEIDESGKAHFNPVNTLMQSTLELASSAPLALNRIMMNDVRKRLGDIRTTDGTHGAWARYDGGKLSGEAGLENDFRTIQVGIDTVPTPDSARMGVAFSYTDSGAEYARGSADMKAYSLAMYGTKMFDNGMFVDVIGRMGTADTDLMVDGQYKGSMNNVALSVSGEMGWRFDLTDMVYVEPQAEVTYTYVNDDKVSVSTANYDIDAVNSLMGRVGFAAGLKCPDNFGNVYVRASAVHEFLGDAKITGVNGDKSNTYEIDGKDSWVEYGIGANFNITKSTYVWTDVERTTGGALDEDWRATVGVRYAW